MVKQVPEEHLKAVRFCPAAIYSEIKRGYGLVVEQLVANQLAAVRFRLPAF